MSVTIIYYIISISLLSNIFLLKKICSQYSEKNRIRKLEEIRYSEKINTECSEIMSGTKEMWNHEKDLNTVVLSRIGGFKILSLISFGLIGILCVINQAKILICIITVDLLLNQICLILFNSVINETKSAVNNHQKIICQISIVVSILLLIISRIIMKKPGFNILLIMLCAMLYQYPVLSLQKIADKCRKL